MCGIVGALTFDAFEKKSEERIRTESSIFITTQLLQATVERGKDATGISLLWNDGNFTGLKMGIPSPDFIARFGETEKDFEGILKLWREYPKLLKIFMGHCRKSSVGNSYDNKNNHPIQIGNIVMIHNGTLTNHEKIFDKLKCDRTGDVDSEAIGRLLHHYTNGGNEPFTTDMLKEVTARLHGTYSVLAMSGNNPYQIAQFRDGRPAEMVLVRPLKMVFIASEKKYLENVLFEYNKQAKLFMTGNKWPYLKQADVDFKTLQDDSCAVWDLTVPVTDKTEIGDLYDWEKTCLRVDKVWGNSTTTTNNTYNNNRTHTQKKPGAGTVVSARTTGNTGGASADDKDDPNGLIWSRSLNKYKTQTGIGKSKNCGAVTVDVETAEITPVEPIEDAEEVLPLKEVSEDKIESLITDSAATKELSIKAAADAVAAVDDDAKKSSTDKGNTNQEADDPGATVEVDMTSDPEAIKAAEDFVGKGLTVYENDDEVANDLDLSDGSVVRPLPTHALANRIKKFVFKQGFIAGYLARKAQEKDFPGKEKKIKNIARKIRVMKFVVRVLSRALEYRTRGNTEEVVRDLINTAVGETVKTPEPAKLDMTGVFSLGDFINMPLLKEIQKRTQK